MESAMKKTYIIICILMVYASQTFAENLRIKGSSTVLPIAQITAEHFMKKYPQHSLIIEGGGSGVGIAALMDKTTDIANASRQIKAKEIKKFQMKNIDAKVHVVGKDALSVIIHPSNQVKSLTINQISDIFRGIITNWKQVGGKNMKIVPIARESSSGTYGFFKKVVLKNKAYSSKCLAASSNGAIVQSVSQTEGAIGYAGIAYVNKNVKSICIKTKKGKTIEPCMKNAVNGTYPLVRNLNMITNGEPKGLAKKYFDFVFSKEGQKLVKSVGYIPIKDF